MLTPLALINFKPHLNAHCTRPHLDAPQQVAEFIRTGCELAKWYERQSCALLQELYLRRVFFELLNHIADPLVHTCIRQQCLEQIYKPLLALKRYYKAKRRGLHKFYLLEREARIISHEFNPYS
ncbi:MULTISPECIES: hypothetical protein [Pseudoalteromonas]|uniref:Uncharacterized protein n=1 Tax=Pseudoalteromonas rubra TaxID=43658 RepID=A0A5S3UQZ8_9GAMM|nr:MULTISPECIES: hypothetical protein [Pseudoalteromonas]MCG7564445.1 hypothetical protein [Pseudoalteromonas sp. McH1-42]MEC4091382.1 hypothetical protein [Pseudoalteromonas rubra]QPB81526.1 hypothetical protein CWC22_000220 [Pseudoalteromonas rubra]